MAVTDLPTVSVVIPTYNRAGWLRHAIRSVLNQTYEEFELIVVDDASADKTKQLVTAIADDRIRYIRHDENKGAAAARNTGIEHAKGQYIAFQDSDDEWLSTKLEKQVGALESLPDGVGAVYCRWQKLSQGRRGKVYGEPFSKRRLLHHNYVDTPTLVVHRECMREERFDERLPRRQDWELCLRLAQRYEFVFVDEVLVLSRETPQSVTSNKADLLRAYQLIFEKHYELIRKNPRALAEFHYVIGTLQARERRWSRARMHLLKSVLCWPFRVKHWARAVVGLGGARAWDRFFGQIGSG
jgi:glycosyltransferase involved in cell wall biosynthesis